MGPPCPRCRKSDFSYRTLLAAHPYKGEFSPVRITCPSCRADLRIKAKSRLAGAGAIFLLLGLVVLLARSVGNLQSWQIMLIWISAMAIYYFVVWPRIVRFKPWTPFQYWLPKSRIVGYSVYLLLPVALLVLLFYLGVHFEWGM
jgi:hypothetical protein